MNDFTKEELELIAECVEADFHHTNWSKRIYEPLINKIQSMIENYCEHTPEPINQEICCTKCQTALV